MKQHALFNNLKADLLADLAKMDMFNDPDAHAYALDGVRHARVGILRILTSGKRRPKVWNASGPALLEVKAPSGGLIALYTVNPTNDEFLAFPISKGPAGFAFNGVRYSMQKPYGIGAWIDISAPLIDILIKQNAQAFCTAFFLWEEADKTTDADGILEVSL